MAFPLTLYFHKIFYPKSLNAFYSVTRFSQKSSPSKEAQQKYKTFPVQDQKPKYQEINLVTHKNETFFSLCMYKKKYQIYNSK